MGLGKLCDVQGIACLRCDVGCGLATDGCAGAMDARFHGSADHLGAQWPGLLVGRFVDRPTCHPLQGQFGSAASGSVSWSPMADGLRLGFGDLVAQLRAVQCVESQSDPSVHLHSRVCRCDRRRYRVPRIHRMVASVPFSGPDVAGVLEVFGHRPELRRGSRLADGSLPA